MNELEKAIAQAIAAQGNSKEANKAYLEFIKANFIIPIEKNSTPDEPRVLYFEDQGQVFLPVFTNMEFLKRWASEIGDEIQLLNLSGLNLLKGIGEEITVSLNIGSELYKEFNPAELNRMKNIILKLF